MNSAVIPVSVTFIASCPASQPRAYAVCSPRLAPPCPIRRADGTLDDQPSNLALPRSVGRTATFANRYPEGLGGQP